MTGPDSFTDYGGPRVVPPTSGRAAHTNLYLKVLGPDGEACHGGSGRWYLPKGSKPGKWMPAIRPIPCVSGYHVLGSARQALDWLGPTIWLCEVRGEIIDHGDKFVAEQARLIERLPWDDRSARLFACDCAEDVLPIFERDFPGDDRPRRAIEMARRFAVGDATRDELAAARDAAGDAEKAAAWAAAWAAAGDAAWAAEAAWAAGAAARSAQAVRLADVLGIEP